MGFAENSPTLIQDLFALKILVVAFKKLAGQRAIAEAVGG